MPRRSQGRGKSTGRSRGRGRKNPPAMASPIGDSNLILSDEEECLSISEPVPQRKSTGRSRGRGRKNPPAVASPIGDLSFFLSEEEECLSISEPVPQRRRSQRRGRSSMPLLDAELIGSDVEESTPISVPAPQRRRQTQSRGNQNRRNPNSRPVVISLDVTYSSDELDISLESSPEKVKDVDSSYNLTLTPSPEPIESDVESELSDTQGKEISAEITEEKETENFNYSSSGEDEDLFYVDYNKKRDQVLKAAFKEIRKMEWEQEQKGTNSGSGDSICLEDPQDVNLDGESPKRKSGDLDSDLDLSALLDSAATQLPKKKRIKKSKKITQAQKHLKQVSEEISRLQASGDVSIISDADDEDDTSCENDSITLFIKWESNLIRWPVRQFQKFSSVYQDIADRFSLNVDQVLLCYDDKIITRETCPKDLNLKIGDILECGVHSQPTVQVKETVTKHSPDSIPLKVQNADRKGAVTIYIGRHSKMMELMHRYAEEKNSKLENLHFRFDGETLDPSDTPETLDLEGNECIDVFTK